MKRSIGFWMLLGIIVACCWIIVGYLVPNFNFGRSTLVTITAPAAFMGRTMPLGMIAFVLLNAMMYGAAGFIITSLHRLLTHRSQ